MPAAAKVAVHTRVSFPENKSNLDSQVERLVAYCTVRGYQVNKVVKEIALVTEGVELHQELIERLAGVPAPAGPTPRELEAERKLDTKVVPLKSVRRTKNQKKGEP